MYLSRIEIENYAGISSTRIDFNETTVLIGENNSGKTAILNAICKVISRQNEEDSLRFLPREFHQVSRKGAYAPAGDIRISLTFREREADEWSFLQKNEMGITFPDNQHLRQELSIEVTASPGEDFSEPHWRIIVPGIDTSNLNDDPSVLEWIRRMNPVYRIRGGILTNAGVLPGASGNVNKPASALNADDLASRISQHVENLLSGTSPDFHHELKSGYNAAMRYIEQATGLFKPEIYPDRDIIFEILGKQEAMTGHSRRMVSYRHGSAAEMIGMFLFTTAMLQSGIHLQDPSSEPIFIIEDPEANLHPMTLESVRLLINRLKWQKIITTQSGGFLSGFPMQDILRITRKKGIVSQWRVQPDSLHGDELRRLSYHIRMRRSSAHFARCWLLVEGESETWLLPHLAKQCGYELNMEGVVCVEYAQCGIAPLIKTARQLGIEWFLLSDGDTAGKDYIETTKHFAVEEGAEYSRRFARLKEKDIEHHMYFNGYSGVYQEYSGIPLQVSQNMSPRRVIERAIHRNSKPFMAIAVVEAIARQNSPGVPVVLRKLIETAVELARYGASSGFSLRQ